MEASTHLPKKSEGKSPGKFQKSYDSGGAWVWKYELQRLAIEMYKINMQELFTEKPNIHDAGNIQRKNRYLWD